MDQQGKDTIVAEARTHIAQVRESVVREMGLIEHAIERGMDELRNSEQESEEIRMVQEALVQRNDNRQEELKKLLPSPYFTRCDVSFDDDPKEERYYFSKFSFDKESILSWMT